MASGDTKTNQYLDIAANGTRADLPSDTCCETRSQTLIRGVAERIMDVEDEVERLENNPDVADIVATYADLQAYDTSQLTDKDVIRVLQDETHDGDSTYYRWSTGTQSWTYIGESKQYTAFVGTDGTSAGTAGLVPAPATTDAGKYLKADGSWDTVSGGIPTNATFWGASYDSVNNKVSGSLILPNQTGKMQPYANSYSGIGFNGADEVHISGKGGQTFRSVSPSSSNDNTVWQFNGSTAGQRILFQGAGSTSQTLRLSGVTDPTDPQDAATKNYVDTKVGNIETILQTLNSGTGAN